MATYEDASAVYLILELCEVGQIFDHLISMGTITEQDVSSIFKQMVQLVDQCKKTLQDEPESPIVLVVGTHGDRLPASYDARPEAGAGGWRCDLGDTLVREAAAKFPQLQIFNNHINGSR